MARSFKGEISFPDLIVPRVSLSSSVDRTTRRQALKIIFTELRSTTFRERMAIVKELYKLLSLFVYCSRPSPTFKQLKKWTLGVQTHAHKLADLLNSMPKELMRPLGYPRILGPEPRSDFIDRLRKLEEATKQKFSSSRGRKTPSTKAANLVLIIWLNEIYATATGKQGRAGRVHDHYGRTNREGKPGGPFFRLIKAALALVGDKQGDEAIFRAIQDHTAQGKIEELEKEVDRAIVEDGAKLLHPLSESADALIKAYKANEERAKKLIDDAEARRKRLEKQLRRPRLTTRGLN
jgi:hypothetical protein